MSWFEGRNRFISGFARDFWHVVFFLFALTLLVGVVAYVISWLGR